jgi:hypothetical protein
MDRHELFAKNLEARLNKAAALAKNNGTDTFDYLSEDCIRYDYFSAILEAENRASSDLVLEYPHPNDQYVTQSGTRTNGHRKEIDCVVLENGKPREAIEFKYFAEHRNSSPARMLHMGGLFADCYRLLDAGLGNIERTVVLVSRKTMNDYIGKENNGFSFLFGLNKEYHVEEDFFANHGTTFIQTIREKTSPEFEPYGFSIERIWQSGPLDGGDNAAEYVIAVFRVTN